MTPNDQDIKTPKTVTTDSDKKISIGEVRDSATEEPGEYDSKPCIAKIFDHVSILLEGRRLGNSVQFIAVSEQSTRQFCSVDPGALPLSL